MGRNEIRLRRNRMSSGRIAQHRNYGDIMARHERDQKIRRIARIFTYFIIILVIILIFYAVRVWERRQSTSKQPTAFVEKTYDDGGSQSFYSDGIIVIAAYKSSLSSDTSDIR